MTWVGVVGGEEVDVVEADPVLVTAVVVGVIASVPTTPPDFGLPAGIALVVKLVTAAILKY